MKQRGRKDDQEKPRWDLLPLDAVEEVVKVLTHGAKKYDDDNWKLVAEKDRRYFAAALRHIKEWKCGEKTDEETGLNHLAHSICCLLFLLWNDRQNDPK